MLEKMSKCMLISKLWAILLMEADFNFANKTLYGVRMLDNAQFHGIMMEGIFSKHNRMADNSTQVKTLFYDILRLMRVLVSISLIELTTCYDSIVHAIASLVFQSFGLPEEEVRSILVAIEGMIFFLLASDGAYKDFAGSTNELKFQGL